MEVSLPSLLCSHPGQVISQSMYSRISKEFKKVVLPPRAEIAGLIPSTEVMLTLLLPGTFF